MSALHVEAIRCLVRKIVSYALANDRARLPIRAALRDALAAVERRSDYLSAAQTHTNTEAGHGRRM